MTLPLVQYAKFKDRYCIYYLGPCKEYIYLLSCLRPAIEAELPGIQIYLCGRDEFISKDERTFGISGLDNERNEMAYVRELTCDLVHHPIEQIIDEAALMLTHWTPPTLRHTTGTHYVVCPNATLPTRGLSPQQIDRLKMQFGQHLEISENIENADWVIGVENEPLWKAAALGIKTTLIPTGLGLSLYKKLFPSGKILYEQHI